MISFTQTQCANVQLRPTARASFCKYKLSVTTAIMYAPSCRFFVEWIVAIIFAVCGCVLCPAAFVVMFILFLKRLQKQLDGEEESLSNAHEVILEEHAKFKPSHIIRTSQGHFMRVAVGEEPERDGYGPARETWQFPADTSAASHVLDSKVDSAGNEEVIGNISSTATGEPNDSQTHAISPTLNDNNSDEDAGTSFSCPCL